MYSKHSSLLGVRREPGHVFGRRRGQGLALVLRVERLQFLQRFTLVVAEERPVHPDSLPQLVDVGPGSPVGAGFGYGAKFPAKYQKALYILDWTFGTIYAIHMEANGASYTATKEEFVSRTPLPLTDVVIGSDGARSFRHRLPAYPSVKVFDVVPHNLMRWAIEFRSTARPPIVLQAALREAEILGAFLRV